MMYNTLAHYYDRLVKDEQATQAWVDWVLHFVKGDSILELACGSGEITLELAHHNKILDALDLSEEMIKEAQKKVQGESIRFFKQNMLNLSPLSQYDAILCLCDSFNYLLEKEEVIQFFEECYAHLKEQGYLLFDTHSLDRLVEFSGEFNETGAFEDGVQYQWSIMSEDEWIYQDFAFYFEDGTIQEEHHLQRVYDPSWLKEAFAPYFDLVDLTTDFNQAGIAEGEKYFYVLKRKGNQ